MDVEKNIVEKGAFANTARIAQTQAAQTAVNLAMIDQLLLLIRLNWVELNNRISPEVFERFADSAKFPMTMSIFDQHGALKASSEPGIWVGPKSSNVNGQSFFSFHRDNSLDALFIGMPLKEGEETTNSVRFSRRVLDKRGEFVGVIVASLKSDQLVAEYDRKSLGKNGILAAFGEDGVIRAFQHGASFHNIPPIPAWLKRNMTGSSGDIFVTKSEFGDATDRYISWRTVNTFPLIVVAGAAQEDVLKVFQERKRLLYQAGILATLAIIILTAVAVVLSVKFAFHRHRLQLSQDAYRKATEGGNEGFFIVQPIVDESGQVLDYMTLDCNAKGAAFANLPREKLIGSTFSSHKKSFSTATKALDDAMLNGFSEVELEIDNESRNEIQHVHMTAVKSNDVLSITIRDITLEKAHIQYLEKKNNEDALTGLPNRAWVNMHLPQAIKDGAISDTKLAVLFIDLDGFKAVNDTLGHAAGDELLVLVGKRLTVALRPSDKIARLGGDEFIIILENIASEAEAANIAGRIVESFRSVFALSKGSATVGTSIGISIFPNDAGDVDELLSHADIAMYKVKAEGKNRYQFFDFAFYDKVQQRQKAEGELRAAIHAGEFVMYYQARVDAKSLRIYAVEALVRWNHPTRGILIPEDFLSLAEDTGLSVILDELVIAMVCAQIVSWNDNGDEIVPVAINISGRHFFAGNIPTVIGDALMRYGLLPSNVEIEVRESTIIHDQARTAQGIADLHGLGIKLLIDEFGAGYSSLSMLHELDFDAIKVDKSFTHRLGRDRQGEIFYGAIITMAHSLGMRVVAGGVECVEQITILRNLGCDEFQGFYHSEPIPAPTAQRDIWELIAIGAGKHS